MPRSACARRFELMGAGLNLPLLPAKLPLQPRPPLS